MERHERIAKAIAASGKKKGEIAKACGVANSAVTQWISGESKSLRPENLYALAAATGFRAEWLAIGAGLEHEEQEPGSPSEKDYALIPQYTAKGSAGSGYHNDHVELKGGLVFKRDWLKRMSLKETNLSVIYADGQSMEPTIAEGEVLLVDEADTEPKSGKVYALLRPNGEVSIKRLVQSFAGGWVISSDNLDKRAYPDEPISEDAIQQIGVIGRIVWRGGGM
ncbi:helix-turn-helix transcriptional regulator [Pseudomonas cavernicola]|uniref:Helix-turn-helix transcriptional regulator n=1 Tax=Pseudomonas cavernicola TaxID=2320866 RepID=A0A418XEY2_9PSED|nr:S24 family peptidase [Pseudomonas cavernicola]RJG10950.1 helix-turn-helix transcriptional regulator [Pseudomonas cavernicola]